MKKTIAAICAFLFALGTGQAHAAGYAVTGKVGWIQINSASNPADTFALRDVSTLGNCRTGAFGGKNWVYVRFPRDNSGDRLLGLLMTARASDWALELSVDDAIVDTDGYCFVRFLRVHDISSPP